MSFSETTPPAKSTPAAIIAAVENTLAGETSAFSVIVAEHELKIASFLLKRCPVKTDADDLLQETFIAAYKNLSQYNPQYPFSAWIFGIARNKANEHFRKIQKLSTTSADHAPEAIHAETPHHKLSTAEQADLFWTEAKRILSEDQFTALWLKYQEEQSIAEISETMQKSLSNVKIQLFRARKALAQSKLINAQYTNLT